MNYTIKRKVLLFMTVFSALLAGSCRDELDIYQIERQGVFTFSTDQFTTQYADNIHFFQGKTVLHYYETGNPELFTRYLLTADGITTAGRNFTISIEFDLINDGTYIGIYRPQYEPKLGGLYSFTYLEEISKGTYKSYNLDPSYLSENFIRVERQNDEEKLVLGDFFAKLQDDQTPSDKIVFYDGIFKDISYVLE